MFADNEAERQRRMLTEENELMKKRVRALETIMQSANLERAKFMEGASWIGKKAQIEGSKFASKLYNLAAEFDHRSNACVSDPNISEVDGPQFLKLRDWMHMAVQKEGSEIS